MPTPAEILERNAQQAKAAAAGGGKAHEGGGLLADADFEVSEESEMVKESNAFWMEKFSLKICGRNLSAENTRKLLIAGASILCVMMLVTIVAVSSASDDGTQQLPPKAQDILRSGVFLPLEFVVQADSIDRAEDEAAWDLGFEQDLVTALNDRTEGLPSLGSNENNRLRQWTTDLVLTESQVAVVSIVDTHSHEPPCESESVDAKKVTVYFKIQSGPSSRSDSWGIVSVFDNQRPRSSWCWDTEDAKPPLAQGRYSRAIVDINVNPEMFEDDHVQVRREGVGPCVRSGRSNCGDHADCIDTAEGHECVCQSGYKRGSGATSCVEQGGDVSASVAIGVNTARQQGDYLEATADQITTCEPTAACGGMIVWRLKVTLKGGARNVYAMFGVEDHALELPPAYQVPEPFGVSVGGVNPLFFETAVGDHKPEFDSWVTIGETGGTIGQIATIGIDWTCWQDHDVQGCDDRGGKIEITDGAVFWMDPNEGPDGVDTRTCPDQNDNRCPIVVAQVTMRADRPVQPARIGAQGRHNVHDNWKDYACWCFDDSTCRTVNSGCV